MATQRFAMDGRTQKAIVRPRAPKHAEEEGAQQAVIVTLCSQEEEEDALTSGRKCDLWPIVIADCHPQCRLCES